MVMIMVIIIIIIFINYSIIVKPMAIIVKARYYKNILKIK